MALDGIILAKTAALLQEKLPFRINRISQASKTEIIFNIHAQGNRTNLVMSFHSVYNHIGLSDRNYTTYTEASSFIMVLRKYLQNGIIDKITQNEYDRYLLLHIRALNDLYDEKEYLLSVELMGKYANLVLIDHESGRIIDALKRIAPYENNSRTILQGARFVLPQKQNKADPFKSEDIDFDDSLVSQLQGFSKTLEKEVRYRMEQGESFKAIIEQINASASLYLSELKDGYDYHVLPLTHLKAKVIEYPLFAGFEKLYYGADEKERIKNVTNDIFKFVKRQSKHYATKIAKLEASLEEALNPQSDKENGDLLYQLSDLNKKGLKETEVIDYDGSAHLVKLDPRYSIKENANRYYQSYQKKRKSKTYILEQLEIAQKEAEYFKAINEQLTIANYEDALDIKDELLKYGYLKNKDKHQKAKKKKIKLYRLDYEGYTITFGKNNIQNDHLTFDFAKANDLWFHAKDFHGCHLVINDSNPPEAVIRFCANLAAYYSKGRLSSSVPVDYCLVRNVKKVKGAKAGFVTIRNQKTIYIDPEEIEGIEIKTI